MGSESIVVQKRVRSAENPDTHDVNLETIFRTWELAANRRDIGLTRGSRAADVTNLNVGMNRSPVL